MSIDVQRAKYNADQIRTMAKNGQAMPDGSYPIGDLEDLRNAIRAVGRGSGSHDAIRRHIMKRAKALGAMHMIPDNWMADGSMRAEFVSDGFVRAFPLGDARILSRAEGYGDGRTVEALVAVWDTPAEIVDGQGHYTEVIDRNAFNKAIADARPQGSRTSWKVGVFYNHGMTLHGTPSDIGSMPVGSPIDIRADPAGLLTVTRYNQSARADEILEAIRNGDLSGHSFSGRFIRSDPQRTPARGFRPDATGRLTNVRRLELGLREYGPTPLPAYAETAVLSVRSFSQTTPPEDPEEPVEDDTPDDSGAVTDEPPAEPEEALAEHSSRSQELTRAHILAKIERARVLYPGLARGSEQES